MKNLPWLKFIYQLLAFFVPLAVYTVTLAPSVTFIDSGELATVAAKLAVGHPTGYPLFTLLGNMFSKLPIGTVILNINFMCAVISSVTALIFFNLLMFIFNSLNLYEDTKYELKNIPDKIKFNIALSGTFILTFSKTFWDSATSVEVYSLHSFFLVTNIYLFLKAIGYKKQIRESENNEWILFAFVLGLSFTNHLTTVFLSVGFLYLYFSIFGYTESSIKNILKSALPFLLGYSLNIYLIVRTGNEIMSWGEPDTFGRFYSHIFGKQFANLMFGSMEIASAQFSYFISNYPFEFYIIPLLLIIPGLIEIRKFSRRFFIFTLLLFFFNLIYAINYNVVDIENYFLLLIIVSVIWMSFGLMFLIKKFNEKSRAVSFAFILICIIPLTQNYAFNNKSGDYTVRDFISNIYNSAPENSIIFSTQWNVVVSPSLYFKFIENLRPDLVVINKEQLSERWYINFIKKHYPDIYNKSSDEFELYGIELAKYENNPDRYTKPENEVENQEIVKFQTTFKNLLNSIVNKNYIERNIFITYEVEEDKASRFANDYSRISQGLLFKLSKDKYFDEYKQPEFEFQITDKTDFSNMFITKSYLQAYMGRANYLMGFQKFDEAEYLLNKAVQIMPASPEIRQLQNKLMKLKSGKK